MPSPPHASVKWHPHNLTPFDFSQSVVKLYRHQTELTHSTQWLHQQTTDVKGFMINVPLVQ